MIHNGIMSEETSVELIPVSSTYSAADDAIGAVAEAVASADGQHVRNGSVSSSGSAGSAGEWPQRDRQQRGRVRRRRRKRKSVVDHEHHGPDWHRMATLYLPRYAVIGFNVILMGLFLTILTSYGIAGPQSIGEIVGGGVVVLTVPFCVFLTLVVVYGQRMLATVVSALTFAKGSLLVVVVAVSGLLAAKVQEDYSEDWASIGDSFLLTTVALGGVFNVMPVYFQRLQFCERDLKKFRLSVMLGLVVVWLLNVFWALFLLEIIPQHGATSLQQARDDGKIATVPLSNIIDDKYESWKWLSWGVRFFIAISVTVSFIVTGSGFKHLLDGYVSSMHNNGTFRRLARRMPPRLSSPSVLERTVTLGMYAVCFGIVLIVAVSNPSGFIVILENFSSLALNVQAGIFLCAMVYKARQMNSEPIPLQPSKLVGDLALYSCMVYFIGATVFDIVVYSKDMAE